VGQRTLGASAVGDAGGVELGGCGEEVEGARPLLDDLVGDIAVVEGVVCVVLGRSFAVAGEVDRGGGDAACCEPLGLPGA